MADEWDWAVGLFEDSGYLDFARSVKHEARYIQQEAPRRFMAKVLMTLPQRGGFIEEG